MVPSLNVEYGRVEVAMLSVNGSFRGEDRKSLYGYSSRTKQGISPRSLSHWTRWRKQGKNCLRPLLCFTWGQYQHRTSFEMQTPLWPLGIGLNRITFWRAFFNRMDRNYD